MLEASSPVWLPGSPVGGHPARGFSDYTTRFERPRTETLRPGRDLARLGIGRVIRRITVAGRPHLTPRHASYVAAATAWERGR